MKKVLLFIIVIFPFFLCTTTIGKNIYEWEDENGTIHFSDKPPPQGVQIKETTKVPEKKSEDKPDIPSPLEKNIQEIKANLEEARNKLKKDIKSVEKRIEEDRERIDFHRKNLSEAKNTPGKWRDTNINIIENNLRTSENNLKNHEVLLRDLKDKLAEAEKLLREFPH